MKLKNTIMPVNKGSLLEEELIETTDGLQQPTTINLGLESHLNFRNSQRKKWYFQPITNLMMKLQDRPTSKHTEISKKENKRTGTTSGQ